MKKRAITSSVLFPPIAKAKKRIVIIGGGVNGALSALELTKSGHHVTLIEAGSIGNGSSSRSAACIRQQFQTETTVRGMIFSTEYYKNWNAITNTNTNPIVQCGYLFLKDWKTDIKELESIVDMQKQAGLEDVTILSDMDVFKMFPYINPIGIKAATWCDSDGYLHPDAIFKSAVDVAKQLGATIITNDALASVQFSGTYALSVSTISGKTVFADIFINATGVWAPKISLHFRGMNLDIKARKRYLYFLDGSANISQRQNLTSDYLQKLPMIITPNGAYCRSESSGSKKIMIGWLQYAQPIDPIFESQDTIEKGFGFSNIDEYGYAVHKEIHSNIPDIESIPFHSVTTGFYEDTPDHNPVIGYDANVPNLIHCAGFSGHGLMHGPFSARIINHLVTAGHNLNTISLPEIGEVDIKIFHCNREFKHIESMVI